MMARWPEGATFAMVLSHVTARPTGLADGVGWLIGRCYSARKRPNVPAEAFDPDRFHMIAQDQGPWAFDHDFSRGRGGLAHHLHASA